MVNLSQDNPNGYPGRSRIYSVSELTESIRSLLETAHPMVWTTGEVSNCRIPSSGHCYFTLKDSAAQISAVMFRPQLRNLRFRIEDGMNLTAMGRISVYGPRGAYQIILEYAEPHGAGAAQAAFEQLKTRLAAEGLFDAERKRPLPFPPGVIRLITSPTGAVVHDVITVAFRRFPDLCLEILPVSVQGADAEREIVAALALANERPGGGAILLARGGGSLEDLAAFNSEAVARAIVASRLPVVTGIGHETDVTIADFAADLRAPTPSAAAEVLVPVKADLVHSLSGLSAGLAHAMTDFLDRRRQSLAHLTRRMTHPGRRLASQRIHLDDLTIRLGHAMTAALESRRWHLRHLHRGLAAATPLHFIMRRRLEIDGLRRRLQRSGMEMTGQWKARHDSLFRVLTTLDPVAVLDRGYSITQTVPDGRIVRSPAALAIGQFLDIRLAGGMIRCRVEDIRFPEESS